MVLKKCKFFSTNNKNSSRIILSTLLFFFSSFIFAETRSVNTVNWYEFKNPKIYSSNKNQSNLISSQNCLIRALKFGNDMAENGEQTLDFGGISGELIAGALGGFFTGVGGAYIGYCLDDRSKQFYWGDHGLWKGFMVGHILGCASSVYFIGNSSTEKGNFVATLGGSILADALIIKLFLNSAYHRQLALFLLISAPVGGTIGFNLSRTSKNASSVETGFINIKKKRIELSIPIIYYRIDYENKKSIVKNINLVSVQF